MMNELPPDRTTNVMAVSRIQELESFAVADDETGSTQTIRTFSMTLDTHHGVNVHLSSLGASITKIILPSSSNSNSETDDVVLGYKSPQVAWETGNPAFLGSIVGRVANRIRHGELQLDANGPVYQLDKNNDPNHLHGGVKGFGRCIWDANVIAGHEGEGTDGSDAVKFILLSPDGDQHYPGAVLVTATYSLQATESGVKLCLQMEAMLQENSRPTPINLSQHSYFNLSRHDDPQGVLDHKLTLPAAFHYTPTDDFGIPTRSFIGVAEDAAMDWTRGRLLRDALMEYGRDKAMLSDKEAKSNLLRSRIAPEIAVAGPDSMVPGQPYGFDHNYIVDNVEDDNMRVVGVLEHEPTRRRLIVRSDAPGVQLYTTNHLDGVYVTPHDCKNDAIYRQWQGVCLEPQSFPDSMLVDAAIHPEFFKGKCRILTPDNPHYTHNVEYEFNFDVVDEAATDNTLDVQQFRGSDTDGRTYESLLDMWESQGVFGESCGDWYERAADYYEENCEASLDGVLGGFAAISDTDLKGSSEFVAALDALAGSSFQWSTAASCECGAGIGRVTKGLLLPLGFSRCDLVESSPRLISAAPEHIGDDADKCRFYCNGLQDWEPAVAVYSLVWIQWVLCYLTDHDAILFLGRCAASLVNGGFICIKENTCNDQDFVLDVQDASVTRSVGYLRSLAKQAGLVLVKETLQDTFPSDIYPVPMLAFRAN